MNDVNRIFEVDHRFKPKKIYKELYNFAQNNRFKSEYEKVVGSFESLHHVPQKHFVLELYDPFSRGLESYCFSMFKDDTGFYTIYKNDIKHFRNYRNALKYQCAKHVVNSKLDASRMTYVCLENSRIRKDETFRSYIDRSYQMKKRLFVK